MVEELFPDPFPKNQNWVYLMINSLKFYTVCFYFMPSWELSKDIETRFQTTFALYKAFFEHKKRSETSLSASFSEYFWRKIFLLLYSINWPNLIVWLPLLRGVLGNMCIVTVCEPGCDVINFEINLIFLLMPFFLHDQKVKTKI